MQRMTDLIPPLPAESLPAYDCNNGAVLYLLRDQEKQALDDYTAAALDMGFTIFDQTVYGGNDYVTLRRDGLFLHVYYTPCDRSLRIIADPYTAPYDCRPVVCETRCKTTLWQFEVDHTLIDCGMCYIVRCCDNSFFLVDSAHNYSIHDNDRIYQFLREHTPAGEKIRIAGWFLSHGHEDHVAKFSDFVEYNCGDDVEIEAVYCNLVSWTHRDSHYWAYSNMQLQRRAETIIDAMSAKVVKLHSGQHFYVRNLEFRVLCTHEDVYPDSLKNFNDSSTMLIMRANGAVVQFPGDAGYVENDICVARFGKEDLACDIMQVAHHGHLGLKEDYYAMAAPQVALFPITQIKFDEEWDVRPVNHFIVEQAKETYIASNGTVEIDLPYEAGLSKKFDDETFESFEGVYNLWGYTYTEERKEELRQLFIKNGGDRSKIRK